MYLIVGLGNPEEEYSKTRHNMGFEVINELSKKYNIKVNKNKFNALYGTGTIGKEKVILVKPQTYMNLSGDAVIKLKNWYKVDNNDILVIYDDFDIPFESVRYRDSGSAGTHNGMKDIVNKLATKDIPRLRIGTGGLKKENQEVISFVLSKFSKDELDELNNVFEKAYLKFKEFLDK